MVQAMASVRERLIAAATQLLDQGGPATVTLREVGRLAGVSHNAPYKHFTDKEDLLAAVAARELARQSRRGARMAEGESPDETLRTMMHNYVKWAARYPHRFKLTFGSWSIESSELDAAATTARRALVDAVERAQRTHALPPGDPERVGALILAVAHGSVDLALGGHLSSDGKGRADPDDLIDDLLTHLRRASGVNSS
jgi:AcrR family transcriptional regulator